MNKSVVGKDKWLNFEASSIKKICTEAVNTSVYLRKTSVVTGLNNKTPYEV